MVHRLWLTCTDVTCGEKYVLWDDAYFAGRGSGSSGVMGGYLELVLHAGS